MFFLLIWTSVSENAAYYIHMDESHLDAWAQWAVAQGPPPPRGPPVEGAPQIDEFFFFFFWLLIKNVGMQGAHGVVNMSPYYSNNNKK